MTEAEDQIALDDSPAGRTKIAASIGPGLDRLKDALGSNPSSLPVALNLGKVIDFIEELLVKEDTFGPIFASRVNEPRYELYRPLYKLPMPYLFSLKEWVLANEVKALSYSRMEAFDSLIRIIDPTLQACAEALKKYDQDDENGRALAYRTESFRLLGEGIRERARMDLLDDATSRAVERAEHAAGTIEVLAEHAAEAAGTTASSELATHYSFYADKELRRYRMWIGGMVLAVSASLALAWFVVRSFESASWSTEEAARLLILLPVLALAAYASRQAIFHRDAEAQSRVIAVQLKTVRAFTDFLDPAAKSEILTSLGRRMFTPNIEPSALDGGYGVPAEVTGLLKDFLANRGKADASGSGQ